MAKDLTTSKHGRQNILNNRYAIKQAESHLDLGGILYQGGSVFTKNQLVEIFNISDATVERYLSSNGDELKANGYFVIKGQKLREFKSLYFGTLVNEGTKTTILGLFPFRAVLNLAMLITESPQAKIIRSRLLDIVLDVVAERVGGSTKYINQRDDQYIGASFQEEGYRKQFTDALDSFVEENKWKYARFTNLIYQSIFQENAAEYRKILKLAKKTKIRKTLYSEVLNLIASYESGMAHELGQESSKLDRKLSIKEAEQLVNSFGNHPLFKPLITDVRSKMDSRDLCFREALHDRLENYIQSVPEADFEKFLGETSKSLEERISDPETLAVFKRLKDR